jgi:hypothetical protein
MAGFTYLVIKGVPWEQPGFLVEKSLALVGGVVGGGILYGLGCLAMGLPEAREVVRLLKKKLGRKRS